MGRQLILEIACLLVTLYASVESLDIANDDTNGEDCETPDHWEGECVELHKCPALLALTENANRSPNETTFLEQSDCGKSDSSEYVCCRFKATDLLPDTRHCGQSFHNRIYGGSATHLNEYPWTAIITMRKINDDNEFICGGTLINNRYVLTAAHCLIEQELNIIEAPVRLGEWNVTTDPDCEVSKNGESYCADPHLDVGIEEFIIHPNYTNDGSLLTHDIALIRLDRYVNFTEFIQPVCLPIYPRLRFKTYDDSQMVAIGWGRTATEVAAAVKQKAFLSGVNLDVCSRRTGAPLLDIHLCAGEMEDASTCAGDSGGPLVYQQSVDFHDVYVLVGIASMADKKCHLVGGIAVFSRVGSFMDWIQENLRP